MKHLSFFAILLPLISGKTSTGRSQIDIQFYIFMCFESSRNKACFQTVWHEESDARIWDKQFEGDLYFGKLDKLANQAISDFETGKCKET
jgi:hypothetical protein